MEEGEGGGRRGEEGGESQQARAKGCRRFFFPPIRGQRAKRPPNPPHNPPSPPLHSDDLSDDDRRPTRRRRVDAAQAAEDDDDEGAPLPDVGVDLANARGPPREYLAQDPVRRAVAAEFKRFLRTFVEPGGTGERVYRARVRDMCAANASSLVVSYTHLCSTLPTIAVWAADAPRALLDILHGAAYEVAVAEFPEFASIRREVFVRISDLPIQDSVRDLRQYHLNKLVRVSGVATRRTGVFPMLQVSCGERRGEG